jgi:uncharacterized protein
MTESVRPLPLPDWDTQPYWDAARGHRLEMPRCADCGRFCFPPRARCPSCLSTDLQWTELTGRGSVYSFTIVCVPMLRGFEPPYAVAQIELDDQPGLRMIANIVECDPNDIRIGMPVALAFEDVAEDCALPQFRPADA